MSKAANLVFDFSYFDPLVNTELVSTLDACARNARRPPMLPEEFEAAVCTRRFTNGRVDLPLVVALYVQYFESSLNELEVLRVQNCGWQEADVRQLCLVAKRAGGLCRLHKVFLTQNRVGDGGLAVLAAAFDVDGIMPELEHLDLQLNGIDDGGEGYKALSNVCARRGTALYC